MATRLTLTMDYSKISPRLIARAQVKAEAALEDTMDGTEIMMWILLILPISQLEEALDWRRKKILSAEVNFRALDSRFDTITAAKGAANFEKSEDPIYVLENNIPIDSKWYLTNQLSKPLTRIFEPIIDNVEKSLLQGDHTRKIFIPTPTAKKGSLMMFAQKKVTCMGCKVGINEGNLCQYCIPKESQIYLEKLTVLKEAELRYAHLWSEAQRIHGTLHTDIMCTGDGCACQFYRRKKVQADIRFAQEQVDKFGR